MNRVVYDRESFFLVIRYDGNTEDLIAGSFNPLWSNFNGRL